MGVGGCLRVAVGPFISLYGDMEEAGLAFLCDRMVESISLFCVSSVYFLFGFKNVETPTE